MAILIQCLDLILNSFNTIYLSLVRVMSHPITCQDEFLNKLYQSSPDETKR